MHVLVDTSVWIDHLRKRSPLLSELLEAEQVSTHPFVIGELACGNLAKRAAFLGALSLLPHVVAPSHQAVLAFADTHKLTGRGLGWIDMHLFASAFISRQSFWTKDKRLAIAAIELGIQVSR